MSSRNRHLPSLITTWNANEVGGNILIHVDLIWIIFETWATPLITLIHLYFSWRPWNKSGLTNFESWFALVWYSYTFNLYSSYTYEAVNVIICSAWAIYLYTTEVQIKYSKFYYILVCTFFQVWNLKKIW